MADRCLCVEEEREREVVPFIIVEGRLSALLWILKSQNPTLYGRAVYAAMITSGRVVYCGVSEGEIGAMLKWLASLSAR